MQLTKNLNLKELVSKNIYNKFGDASTRFLSKELIETQQKIRDFFDKPIIINNWHTKGSLGSFSYRGFREQGCEVGAVESAHKRGMAIDFNISGIDSNEIRKMYAPSVEDLRSELKALLKMKDLM